MGHRSLPRRASSDGRTGCGHDDRRPTGQCSTHEHHPGDERPRRGSGHGPPRVVGSPPARFAVSVASLSPEASIVAIDPGESAAPGTSTGQTGTPDPQTAGIGFTVTVNAVDASFNVISTNDTVHLTSSDTGAVLPADAALVTGTKTLTVTLKTVGGKTITASDVTHAGITADTSSANSIRCPTRCSRTCRS